MKKRVLSGMRPTGKLHLGHLVGALKNWAELQNKYECLFMSADWHALMSEYERPYNLRENIYDNIVDWISCGIEPEKSVIFIQSEVKEHLELFLILSCLTPLGWLERCPTYKEQLREIKGRDLNSYGFLGYPVLQAADILIYKAEKVPVGEDQLAHLELTREIARRFNGLYKKNVFPEPEAILTETPRLLGLDARKMSKSYNNTIDLSDNEEQIKKKISSMFTDPKRIRLNEPGHPDVCNVFSYFTAFAAERKDDVREWCINAKLGCTDCKKELAQVIIEVLAPIQVKRKELAADKKKLRKILDKGRDRASEIASSTRKEIKDLIKI
ncbi:MAG: tryptophan--tRNA ligase [Candidatus Omnitrophica bacterium]|nr:tryptophan--tRNA ligase [Candidatus Omnitrophota bacterium]